MTGLFAKPETIKKIAVLRANALGDLIFVLPALKALKEHFKNAELVYLGNNWHKDFLHGRHSPVDRVLIVPKCNGIPHESDRIVDEEVVSQFFKGMEDENFDIAFQMHGGGGNSNPFVKRLKARLSVGFQAPGAPPLDINIPYHLYQPEILRYLELTEAVGAKTQNIIPEISTTDNDFIELNDAFPDFPGKYMVMHAGASDIRRRWPVEKFALVAKEIINRGYTVILSGTGNEQEMNDRLSEMTGPGVINLTNKISLNTLTAMLSKASLLISNDTGPLHLARALKTPTVGLYWSGNMITAGPATMKTNRYCISWTNLCPLCGLDCNKPGFREAACKHDVSFIADIEVEEVLERVGELICD